MSDQVNFYEIKPSPRKKRKLSTPCENTYMNPALDLVSTDDPMWNNAMEIKVPNKKRKRSKSVHNITTFENCALDLGINKQALCALLSKELQNVCQNLNPIPEVSFLKENEDINNEPVYMNLADLNDSKVSDETTSVSENSPLDYTKDFKVGITNLSFIDKLDLNSSSSPSHSLCLDDDLNESNIMEIKNIDAPKIPFNMLKPTNPFLEDMIKENLLTQNKSEFVYNDDSTHNFQETQLQVQYAEMVVPRRLFLNNTDTTISTVNDVSTNNEPHIYASIDELNCENEYENIKPIPTINKQSKILGHDVSKLSSLDILNLCNSGALHACPLPPRNNDSADSNEGKKHDIRNQLLKVGNKISKKMLGKIWKSKNSKYDKTAFLTTLNPYEVPRKPEKTSTMLSNKTCFENPALNLGNSESESDTEEATYETIKTAKNTIFNMNVTPLGELNSNDFAQNCSNISSKKQVRFNATLNKEKIITGNSFDSRDLNETELDMQIEQFHDELENCINEKKIIAMNL